MKAQEVMMRAMAKRIRWLDAAEILGGRPRTLRGWQARYRIRGYDGLFDRRKQRPMRGMLLPVDRSTHDWIPGWDGSRI
ncbi:MAG: helix-turn-helix domain-containing protein [Methylacidiphilaceae bacterium]|nr:helix-turn-helix domain-containing protein [Candidatus Methylacidiphilaceae bacterium]